MKQGYILITTFQYEGDKVAETSTSPVYATFEAAQVYMKDAIESSKQDGVLSSTFHPTDQEEHDEDEWEIEQREDYISFVSKYKEGRWIFFEILQVLVHDLTNAEGE